MDTRPTPEQAELSRTAQRLGGELGARAVVDLDDAKRRAQLAAAVAEAGWLEMRDDVGSGEPLAGGVEAALVAEALAEVVADVPFSGPLLAGDLARRAGVPPRADAVVGFAPDLLDVAVVAGGETRAPVLAVDAGDAGAVVAYVLVPEGDGFRLATLEAQADGAGADLTRAVRALAPGTPCRPESAAERILSRSDLDAWSALGLALTSADLVGAMRGAIDTSVAYARERRQYGVPIGSFQAVQHLLAEALALLEGARSTAAYAAWAVDALEPAGALEAGRVAKAYCARAARTVCETAVQVHGGIGNTWDCMVHVHLRRALLSAQWFGDDAEQLARIARARLGGADGVS